jgi:hypothetical protein
MLMCFCYSSIYIVRVETEHYSFVTSSLLFCLTFWVIAEIALVPMTQYLYVLCVANKTGLPV